MKATLAALAAAGMLVGTGSLFAKNPKPQGQILDPERFRNVHTYCVRTDDLGTHYGGMVKAFFNEQSKPNSLVNELPWKQVEDCRQADALMSFQFSETSEYGESSGGGNATAGAVAPLTGGAIQQTWFQVVVLVSNRMDLKPIYQVQGDRAPERGERALEKTFRKLAKDLSRLRARQLPVT